MIARHGSTLELLLPALGSVFGLSTILVVYVLTWKAGHLPSRTLTPPISFLGCNSPEHLAYQLGFTLTGIVLLGAIEQWRHLFYSRLSSFGSWSAMAMVGGGYLAVVGVIGQGLVTLEEDILLHLKMGLGISRQSILHQQLAGIFFLGAAMHCYTTAYYIGSTWWASGKGKRTLTRTTNNRNQATDTKERQTAPTSTQEQDSLYSSSLPSPSSSSGVRCCYGNWSIRLKLVCVATSILAWPIAEVLHPARTTSLDKRNFNIAGKAQYIAVASYILFFGSYTLDFASLRILRKEERTIIASKQS
jgi:hypothetical protein